jgi:hypothetical protein
MKNHQVSNDFWHLEATGLNTKNLMAVKKPILTQYWLVGRRREDIASNATSSLADSLTLGLENCLQALARTQGEYSR